MALDEQALKQIQDFLRNTASAQRMTPAGRQGREQFYIFNKPGDINQQKIPPIQIPQQRGQFPMPEWGQGNLQNDSREQIRNWIWNQIKQRILQGQQGVSGQRGLNAQEL